MDPSRILSSNLCRMLLTLLLAPFLFALPTSLAIRETIPLTVQFVGRRGTQSIHVAIDQADNVGTLKQQISEASVVSSDRLRLVFAGVQMSDDSKAIQS
jgi:Ubiquitin family